MAWENSNIALYTKAGQLINRTEFSQWLSAQLPMVCPGGPASCQFSHPSLRYDQLHGRFLLSVAVLRGAGAARQSYFLLAVSIAQPMPEAGRTGPWTPLSSTVTQNWADFLAAWL